MYPVAQLSNPDGTVLFFALLLAPPGTALFIKLYQALFASAAVYPCPEGILDKAKGQGA